MKKILFYTAVAIMAALTLKSCSGCTGEEGSDSNIDNIQEVVTEVEGNVIVLESGLRVRVIGTAADNPWVESYLKANVVGKEVSLVADRKIKEDMEDSDVEIPAYVIIDETKPSVNHQIIIDNPRAFDPGELGDSLETFRPEKDALAPISDLALYMKMRSFLIETPEGLGTGFFINENGVGLTNNHVISEPAGIVGLYNEKAPDDSGVSVERARYITKILYTDPNLDITVFKVQLEDGEKVDYFNLAKQHVPQGTRVATYGNPGGLTATFTSGDLSAYRDDGTLPMVQYSMATNPGNSGGPVADPSGQIVAVHKSGDKSKQNVNYGIDILAVRKILDQLQIKYGGM